MDRRSFFRTMVGGVAIASAVRSWPFRVFSFPSAPIIPSYDISEFATIYYSKEAVETLARNLKFESIKPLNGNFHAVLHPYQYQMVMA